MRETLAYVGEAFRLFMERASEPWEVVDCYGNYCFANAALKRLNCLSDSFQLEGKHYSEIPSRPFEECALEFYRQDVMCMNTRVPVKVLDVHVDNDGEWFCYIFERTPLINNNQVIGLTDHGKSVIEFWKESMRYLLAMQRYYTGENQVSMQITTTNNLTQRESEILFFLFGQVEPKRIARYLNLSLSTVNCHIDRMRKKLGCQTTPQLIEKAIWLDFHKILPEKLMGDCHISLVID
ncbi:helix-turn-helix transcriptional regulator [Endozoicomonas gorgoniicola]|uniref:Helix-turn-helix transcriptional regulator n=1 Tax=Endozoicomonas gorgoniicola TaxID=1234144 RepID=A0ABT3MTI6_9GAMM|nr:helix-turn-helix transcriptional regulator [Endozoicomonas gorgoniicola]MCW7552685.1 helix-turn-helix transcriptional regulator [Endozoicomonas gorgoniicola]